jgi:hypothetical protein
MCVTWLPSMTMQLRGHRSWTFVRMSGTSYWMTQNIGGVCRILATRQAMCPATMSKRRNPLCLTGNISSSSVVTVTFLSCSLSVLTHLLTCLVVQQSPCCNTICLVLIHYYAALAFQSFLSRAHFPPAEMLFKHF